MADVATLSCIEPQNDAELDQKKDQVTGKLQKREEERLADVQRRKDEKDSTNAADESADYFRDNFNQSRLDIETQLQASGSVEKNKLIVHMDSLILKLQKLQKFVSDSARFLPAYELMRAQETVNKFQSLIQDKRDELLPKKKFAFKSKKKIVAEKPTAVLEPKDEPTKKPINVQITECSFSDITGKALVKSSDEATHKDIALSRLSDCTIKIYGSPDAMHVNKLTDCKVFCGPISGSIFIEDCKNCVFILACQQLRVHGTTNTHFYLHVTSRAIIEDCNTLAFAPYNWKYDELNTHYTVSGLDQSRNTWNDVDDFNWLASDKCSPNWAVLDESKRVSSWDC